MICIDHFVPSLTHDPNLEKILLKGPKFHLYQPHIAVLSGIAWDHINVFPTFEMYLDQFRIFKNMVSETLIYCSADEHLNQLAREETNCKLLFIIELLKILSEETKFSRNKCAILYLI